MSESPQFQLARFDIENALGRATSSVAEAFERWKRREQIDLVGTPAGALAYLLASRPEKSPAGGNAGRQPVVVVTDSGAAAERLSRDLRAHLGEPATSLLLPSPDTSPFLEIAADRRVAMDRLSVLFQLAQGLPWDTLVLPIASLMRKVPPREAIVSRSMVVEAEQELDRGKFLRLLDEAGYLKTPLAEDPGTFSVRGGLIDVYPPHGSGPGRIELDDWLVTSIRRFDPDTQRTLEKVERLTVHPVRSILRSESGLRKALIEVRELCDAANYPSSKAAKLVEDLEEGRAFYGVEHYVPAFFQGMESVLDYVPDHSSLVWLGPESIEAAFDEEWNAVESDRSARLEEGLPTYPLEAHFFSKETLRGQLSRRHQIVCRTSLSSKALLDSEGGANSDRLIRNEPSDSASQIDLAGSDQSELASALRTQRANVSELALSPLAERIRAWTDLGLRVVLSSRTESQGKRLVSLLEPLNVELAGPIAQGKGQSPAALRAIQPGEAQVWVRDWVQGFVLPTEGLAIVTEEEVFGSRAKRRSRRKAPREAAGSFLEDLRELKVGDFVVHNDHGIGRYLGIERKVIGQSQLDRMQGLAPTEVEVLVIEYASQDRLFLPVTRLSLLQKFSGKEGHAPKLDKLGGQTFSKTKSKVKKRVKQLAEELLKLYAERAARERDPLKVPGPEYEAFEATFPFEETADQRKAIEDVLDDLERSKPMDRVICGDVGFGKTEVAIRAAFRCAMAGRQVAVLCPTTVLAQQHYLTFQQRLADYPVEVRVLSRFVEKKEQAETVAGLKDGRVDIVLGTHRLLSKDVHFKELGLLVVDEEQRFGVAHKERIKKLRSEVDVLTLSATPIPRTLQLAIGGLRDLSLITTAPIDRRAVRTFATRWNDHLLTEAIRRELSRGGQVFFVYNRIEGLQERAARLHELVPEARLGVAHGQLAAASLEKVMTDFVEGRFDILCSTAIIESGLDIPRANTMIVDRADIFGLSQLYQLRGRVGRSRERAYCYLLTPPPNRMSDEARYRIEALERFTALGSGFHVASLDMEQRGAGDLLGAEQSGAVAQIGFDMFVHMLEDAVAELRGEPVRRDIDPEMTFDVEWYLPDDYIEDVGLRLSSYKRFAEAPSEEAVAELTEEMEDRFGPLPRPAERFSAAMALKPTLRRVRALGAEGRQNRVTLHLQADTPLDPNQVKNLVSEPGSSWSLSADLRLTRRFDLQREGKKDGIERLAAVLEVLQALVPARGD